MNSETMAVIFLLMARLPIYAYVIHKAIKYRRSIVLIHSISLGFVGVLGMALALANALSGSRILINFIGTLLSFSIFYLAFTSKELKPKE